MKFTKVVASGNDFIIVDNRSNQVNKWSSGRVAKWPDFAKRMCERKTGIGADGVLLLEDSKEADVRMRIFNPDGSEPNMCGNGSRCVALYCRKRNIKIETKAGILKAELSSGNRIKVKMTDPKDLQLGLKINLNGRDREVHYINTGVPHVVYFLKDIDNFNVKETGRLMRYHKDFQPEGANANFVKPLDKKSISIRTYERGVEDETLACGTGACAGAIIASLIKGVLPPVSVHTRGGEILKIYFSNKKDSIKNVYLEGEAKIVFEGQMRPQLTEQSERKL